MEGAVLAKFSEIFLKLLKNISSLGDSGGFSALEEFISMLERCSWVYVILPFPPFLKNWKPNFRSWRRSPTARKEIPYKAKRQKGTATLCVFAFFDSCCGIDSEKGFNAIVSYVENQLQLTEKIPASSREFLCISENAPWK